MSRCVKGKGGHAPVGHRWDAYLAHTGLRASRWIDHWVCDAWPSLFPAPSKRFVVTCAPSLFRYPFPSPLSFSPTLFPLPFLPSLLSSFPAPLPLPLSLPFSIPVHSSIPLPLSPSLLPYRFPCPLPFMSCPLPSSFISSLLLCPFPPLLPLTSRVLSTPLSAYPPHIWRHPYSLPPSLTLHLSLLLPASTSLDQLESLGERCKYFSLSRYMHSLISERLLVLECRYSCMFEQVVKILWYCEMLVYGLDC